ncbi:hypothetical protein ABT214_05950 [Micromonospora purpureochromogenes]|uniref:hypothetical protein n=1 Tax=Micromonospora purpureochromogenes TaxID=47872 RepID=UPI00332C55ED
MTDAEVAATAVALVADYDDAGLAELVSNVGSDRVISSLARFAYIQLRWQSRSGSRAVLRDQLLNTVKLMDGPNG